PSVVALALPRASFSTPKASSTACDGETKPIASSTRSAWISNSLPGSSLILPSFHSSRTAVRLRTLFLPSSLKHLVATAQSRWQPSSCELEVRKRSGQYGQVSGLFSCAGGCGSSSNWVIAAAPCRLAVPTQSEPVSPPPITTTCLSLARICCASVSPAT